LGSYKKAELISSLIRHFQNAFLASDPTPSQQKARSWLPEALLFPAIDPSAPVIDDDDDGGVVDENHSDDGHADLHDDDHHHDADE
jgi:hypothetical protein